MGRTWPEPAPPQPHTQQQGRPQAPPPGIHTVEKPGKEPGPASLTMLRRPHQSIPRSRPSGPARPTRRGAQSSAPGVGSSIEGRSKQRGEELTRPGFSAGPCGSTGTPAPASIRDGLEFLSPGQGRAPRGRFRAQSWGGLAHGPRRPGAHVPVPAPGQEFPARIVRVLPRRVSPRRVSPRGALVGKKPVGNHPVMGNVMTGFFVRQEEYL